MTVAFRDEFVLSQVHEIEDRFIRMQKMLHYLKSAECKNPKTSPLKKALIRRIEHRQSALVDTLDALARWVVQDAGCYERVDVKPKQMRFKGGR